MNRRAHTLYYPDDTEEIEILIKKSAHSYSKVQTITSPNIVLRLQENVSQIHIDPSLLAYIKDIVIKTRNDPQILLGASPRASIVLLNAAKALAAISGRDYVIPDDIKSMAFNCLNHRLILRPEIELEGMSVGRIIDKVLESISVP